MKRYQLEIQGVNQKDFPLLKVLPMGLFVLDCLKYKYNQNYDKSLLFKLSELYGRKDSFRYLKVFLANQIIIVMLVLFTTIFLLVAGGVREITAEIIFLIILAPTISVYGLNADLDKQVKKRRRQLSIEFCEFLSVLILLINAGMNVYNGWERIALDKNKTGLFYDEVRNTYHEIISGKSEVEAYEDFAQRCKIPEITKFITIIIQNIKKGNEEMTIALRQQVSEGWSLRKNLAKVLGEEASTKLLLPMMLMFAGILLIVITPAILALSTM